MIRALLTLFLICTTTIAWSQTSAAQKKLEQEKKQIQKEIKEFQNLLNKEDKKEKSVLGQIKESEVKIRLTENLISTIQKQSRLLSDDIYLNQKKVNKLNKELEVLKEDYANTIVKAYKSRSEQSRIMFILSSESFLQAYKRVQYMKQYGEFRKMQAEEIKEKMAELDALIKKLNGQKKEKEVLLTETKEQKEDLVGDKKEHEKLVKIIQKDKKKYAADIKKKQKQERDLQNQIDELIRKAIAEANKKKAKAEGKSTTNVSSSKFAELSKEGKIVADNFKASKGQLPWPVDKGYVSVPYGKYRATSADVKTSSEMNSTGIEITTEKGSSAKAVFDGVVNSVSQINGGRMFVIVEHGNYLTLYYNLSSVNVGIGDKVKMGQKLGTLWTNPITGETVIKFIMTQNTDYLNPQQWLNR
ncbi:murein hydrolase activator EnvC family protein [Flavobacterium beibuense]|uniref:Peptidase M23B n=1 Tax=Flavobacterium beibuense TaxID=657326 RepID=A0A444WDH4_9FLAO|nr:peptidoglycan DD-metalloendopeptidase family protein [Flavobacterium beibuense]RYJ43878.1 Peptidase M23B [Flavobacterium beibuense]